MMICYDVSELIGRGVITDVGTDIKLIEAGEIVSLEFVWCE